MVHRYNVILTFEKLDDSSGAREVVRGALKRSEEYFSPVHTGDIPCVSLGDQIITGKCVVNGNTIHVHKAYVPKEYEKMKALLTSSPEVRVLS